MKLGVIGFTAVVLFFSIPILAIVQPVLSQLIPILYILAGTVAVRYLMEFHHKQKLTYLQKQKELEELSILHLKEAQGLIDTPEIKKNQSE
jgi:hypothetical protein